MSGTAPAFRPHLPYRSMWLSPMAAALAWGLSGLGIAAWVWRHAPLIDNDRPDLTHPED